MTGVLAAVAAPRRVVSSITASANWGSTSGAAPGAVTSAARTLTVPAGNPGKVLLTPSAGAAYSINGGAYTNFAIATIITVTNGQTLTLRFPAATLAGTDVTIDVDDSTTGATIGQAFLQAT